MSVLAVAVVSSCRNFPRLCLAIALGCTDLPTVIFPVISTVPHLKPELRLHNEGDSAEDREAKGIHPSIHLMRLNGPSLKL